MPLRLFSPLLPEESLVTTALLGLQQSPRHPVTRTSLMWEFAPPADARRRPWRQFLHGRGDIAYFPDRMKRFNGPENVRPVCKVEKASGSYAK